MAKVYISAGHSSDDPGAVGYVVERDEVWAIANMVAEELNALGITTYRDGWTYSCMETINDANAKGVDLFVEYHENAGGGQGAECIIHNSGSQSLANAIKAGFAEVGQNWRRTIVDPSFLVLKYTNCTAIIVECAFVDNATDADKFKTDAAKRALAKAQARSIAGYLGVSVSSSASTSGGTGWKQDDKGWWYVKPDGTIYASTWAEINGKWYLFDTNGYMKTGWQQDGGKWYYLNTDGSMQKKWVSYQDKWYYLDEIEGDMTSDEFRKINGDWYRFNPDGTMAEKTTLKVGEDGKITD